MADLVPHLYSLTFVPCEVFIARPSHTFQNYVQHHVEVLSATKSEKRWHFERLAHRLRQSHEMTKVCGQVICQHGFYDFRG